MVSESIASSLRIILYDNVLLVELFFESFLRTILMARHSLRKLTSDLSLENNYRELTELTPPLDLAQVFAASSAGVGAPIEVEIGSGKGLFLLNHAEKNPSINYLGNELAHKYALYAAGKLAKKGFTNAVMVHGDGLRMLHEFIGNESINAVHVYFPDPWWKSRHKKRRVLNEGFLADVMRVLKPGGLLHFWTDVQEYYETTIELIQKVTPLVGPTPIREPVAAHDLDYRTHFERRTRQMNEPVFRCRFVKATK
jgi:tRNA (guanine-N7-)-methyltransferase